MLKITSKFPRDKVLTSKDTGLLDMEGAVSLVFDLASWRKNLMIAKSLLTLVWWPRTDQNPQGEWETTPKEAIILFLSLFEM